MSEQLLDQLLDAAALVCLLGAVALSVAAGIGLILLGIALMFVGLGKGAFIQTVIDFILIAFVIFLFIKAYNRMRKPAEEAAPAEEVLLLREIRDQLRR